MATWMSVLAPRPGSWNTHAGVKQRKPTANTQQAMWALGWLSWQWQEQWVMTESDVGKVDVRGSKEREREEKQSKNGGEEEERGGGGVQSCLARPDHLIGRANRAELTSGWGLFGLGRKWKSSERRFISNKFPRSPTKTALKCCHSNSEKRKLNLFLGDKTRHIGVTANLNTLCLDPKLWLFLSWSAIILTTGTYFFFTRLHRPSVSALWVSLQSCE